MAELEIWVSAMDDPCGYDNRTWYVTIYDCDGRPLEWCGRRYVVLRAPCGHLDVEVPPGCYYIKAVWSYHVRRSGYEYWGNHFTDTAIVQACCGQTTCVKLFNPSAHRCGKIYFHALGGLLRQKLIKAETGKILVDTMEQLLKELPTPVKAFELGHLEEIDELVRKHEREAGNDRGEKQGLVPDPDPEVVRERGGKGGPVEKK